MLQAGSLERATESRPRGCQPDRVGGDLGNGRKGQGREPLRNGKTPKVGTKRGRWARNDLEGQVGVRQVSQSSRLEEGLERNSQRNGALQEPDDGMEKQVTLEAAVSSVCPKNWMNDEM